MRRLKLEWWNTCDLNDILYQMGWRQVRYYSKAELSTPEHELKEEGVTNGDQEFFPLHQSLRKRYHFDVVVPEYELDALTQLPMHDNVWITDADGHRSRVTDVEVTQGDWEGRWLRVRIYFSTHSYVKTPKCRNMTIALPA